MKLDGKTTAELLALQAKITTEPASRAHGSIFLYTPKARKSLDAITRQITHNLATARAERGDPVMADGYSGRKTNRR